MNCCNCRLCRQLDGLPLAIELAAVRVPLLGLQGVQDGLTDRAAQQGFHLAMPGFTKAATAPESYKHLLA